MIPYARHTLKNGLTVILHEDRQTPMAALNVLYKVGSRNESAERTGFAHLFEHLMFGGSLNAKSFDDHIQVAGGDANAFTNNDITSFYESLPAVNIETALWLESDRMHNLILNKKALDTQRKVVVEEFKETCINEPYGDVWHHLSALAYKQHPYRWPVIGLVPEHIKQATLEDVSSFYKRFYRPSNAVLVLAGPFSEQEGLELVERYFGDIPDEGYDIPAIAPEPPQLERRFLEHAADVPLNAIYMAFHMPDRTHPDYYACDLLTDVLAYGKSSRMYHELVRESNLFSDIDTYVTETQDHGLIVVEGRLGDDTSFEQAEAAIWRMLDAVKQASVSVDELQKQKNRVESNIVFSEISLMSKAMNLAQFEALGNLDLINSEGDIYQAIQAEDIQRVAQYVLRPENCSALYYKARV